MCSDKDPAAVRERITAYCAASAQLKAVVTNLTVYLMLNNYSAADVVPEVVLAQCAATVQAAGRTHKACTAKKTLHPILALPIAQPTASHGICNLVEPQTRCKLLVSMTT